MLKDRIKTAHCRDPILAELQKNVRSGESTDFTLDSEGILWISRRLYIPEWKWERITMEFVVGLPHSRDGHDSIWVIVDRLTKSAHFLPVKVTCPVAKLAKLYVKHFVCLHGVPISIVSDRGFVFTSRFWQKLREAIGTRLDFSTAFHPQTDGQSERMIQTLENMLRMCIMDLGGSWNDHLPLVEFSYNNNYYSSIEMALYEALYRRKCRSSCVGMRLEKESCLDLKLFKMPLRKLLD